jgi:predicted nucleic-acid-binding Zn-ribbon protein
MNWYCVKCGSDNVVEDVVMSINNNQIQDVIQDSQRCGDCNYEVLEQKNKRGINNVL